MSILEDNTEECGIDSESIVFWRNGSPSLEFMETEEITYKGENICVMRKDLEIRAIWVYILTYYKILSPQTLFNNIKCIKKKDMDNLFAGRMGKAIVVDNSNSYKPLHKVPFDYQALKEKGAFSKQNAGRYLACLRLAKSYEAQFLPYDPFDARHYFEENFKEPIEEVLDKYCEARHEDKEKLLSHYRNIAERNRSKFYFQEKTTTTKFSTVNLLAKTFLHIAK